MTRPYTYTYTYIYIGVPTWFATRHMFHQDYLWPLATNQEPDGLQAELFRQLLHADNRSIPIGGVRRIGIAYRAW